MIETLPMLRNPQVSPNGYNQKEDNEGEMLMKLDIKAFAITCALVWGSGVLLGTWWIILLDGPQEAAPMLADLYRGYRLTPTGSLIGFVWALIDGLIGGAIFAWLYNKLSSRVATAA